MAPKINVRMSRFSVVETPATANVVTQFVDDQLTNPGITESANRIKEVTTHPTLKKDMGEKVDPSTQSAALITNASVMSVLPMSASITSNVLAAPGPPGNLRVVNESPVVDAGAFAPKAPVENFTDLELLDDPDDDTKKLYLPRYRLATQQVQGRTQYRLKFECKDKIWRLFVALDHFPAPELGDLARDAKVIAHELALILRFNKIFEQNETIVEERLFQEVTTKEGVTTAVLMITDLVERDLIYRVLRNSDSKAKLIARRTFTITLPAPSDPIVQLKFLIQNDQAALDQEMKGYPKSFQDQFLKNPDVFFNELKDYISDPSKVPEWAAQDSGPRPSAPVNLTVLSAGTPPPATPPPPGGISIGPIHGHPLNSMFRRTWERYSKLQEEQKRLQALEAKKPQVTRTLEQIIDPELFVFEKDLHPYIFSGITPDKNNNKGLVSYQLYDKNERAHRYFQDPARPNTFYFLPDRFVIADPGQLPNMTVRFIRETLESVTAQIEYIAVPSINLQRLENAASVLAKQSGLDEESSDMQFEPVKAEGVTFFLALPGKPEGSGPYQPRSGALVDLQDGISDTLSLSLADFMEIYNALFGGPTNLFTGEVTVKLRDMSDESIPFSARVENKNRDDVLNAILDSSVPAEYTRSIELKCREDTFKRHDIHAVIVEFKNGYSAELTEDFPNNEIDLYFPLLDYVLNNESQGTYYYKVTLIPKDIDSPVIEDKDWQEAKSGILYPLISSTVLSEQGVHQD